MERRAFLAGVSGLAIGSTGLITVGCTTTVPHAGADQLSKRRDIDGAADAALTRLYSTVRGASELGGRARAILVFPRVLEAGFVVGGEYGDGVLRTGGRPTGYYRIVGGSFGWQIGAQSKALFLMFLTQEALDRFVNSSGWAAGVDASVAVARVGASGEIDTITGRQSVVGFALTNAGLMANLTLEGSKITRLDI